jgi:hypothetical protein
MAHLFHRCIIISEHNPSVVPPSQEFKNSNHVRTHWALAFVTFNEQSNFSKRTQLFFGQSGIKKVLWKNCDIIIILEI